MRPILPVLTGILLAGSAIIAHSQNTSPDTSENISANQKSHFPVVTVTGAISESNRAPFDAFRDAFFDFHGVSFETAFEFSYADLQDLGMHMITTKYASWPQPLTLRGPYLEDVLAKTGPIGSTVLVQALDGYAAEFSLKNIEDKEMVLAIEADGRPLGIGGRGPVWLIYESQADDENDEGLVWSVFHISVQ